MLFETLEPRILLSGDLNPVQQEAINQDLQQPDQTVLSIPQTTPDVVIVLEALSNQEAIVPIQETEPNDEPLFATTLLLTEDPIGSGLAMGRGTGQQDPAVYGNDKSDPDWWQLDLTKDDVISISVDTPNSDMDPYLWFGDGAGNGITSNENSGPGSDALISHYTVPATGVYFIQVGRYAYNVTVGSYELHVERTRGLQLETDYDYGNDSIGGANTLILSAAQGRRTATVAGTVMAPEGGNTDEDIYNLGLFTAGNGVELSTRLPGDSALAPKVVLLNAAGQVISDTDGNAADGHFKGALSTDGIIYARVEAISGAGSHGQYLLDIDIIDTTPPRITGLTGLPAEAKTVSLNLATLPSTQGWRYVNGSSEASIWSTDGSTLRLNSIGVGGGYGYYQLDNAVDASAPFNLSFRTRLVQEEPRGYSDHYGYAFAVYTGTQYATVTFSPTAVQINGTTTTTVGLDTTAFHDYVLAGTPAGGYTLSVDGAIVARGDLGKSSSSSGYLYFGDATGGPNAKAELTQFAFTQPAGEDLVGPMLGLTFSETLDSATVQGTPGVWRYGGHTYTLTPRSMSWTEAEAEAEAKRLGGHLVTISDAAEQAWVSETFGGWGDWYAWLGATDQTVEGNWVWASGQPLSYTNWGPGQPQSHGSYDWAYLNGLGRWNVTDNTGLGASGWGIIEIDDAGADDDADGLPNILDPYPDNANNVFELREAGTDGSFDTADDVNYTLRQTAFTGTGVSLRINEGTLGPGSYRFTVTPTLTDVPGNALDGNGDGTAGDVYQRFFTVAALPDGYQLEHSGFGPQAPLLMLTEDPTGSGLAIGRAIGRLDPAYGNDYSDVDEWRIELEQGDRVSISVDSPTSTLYPQVRLYDGTGNEVSHDYGSPNYGQGYGPDYDAFISNYQVQSNGTYIVTVTKDYYAGEYRGTYELHVERARGIQQETDLGYGNDSIGGANVLTLDVQNTHRTATVAGTIMAPEGSNTDEDFFNLGTLNAGETLFLSTRLPSDSTLQPALELRNSSNVVVAIIRKGSEGAARLDITRTDTYYAVVKAISGQGSRGQYLLDVAVWPTGELSFADLGVSSITLPSNGSSGETIRVSWTVENFGTGVTDRETWADRIVLSANDQYGDADDVVLSTVQHTVALAVGELYAAEADVQLPRGKSGSYWLFVQADSSLQVFEYLFDGNNVDKSSTQIVVAKTPAADLQITELQASNKAFSGLSLNMSWTITNTGDGTTGDGVPGHVVSDWTDRLVLSRNQLRGDGDDVVLGTYTHSGELAANGAYARTETVQLPSGIEGDYFLYVQTDIQDKVYEEAGEGNNASTFRPLRVDIPRSDLIVSSINAPVSALNGSDIPVSWQVNNQGVLSTGGTAWTDRILLSRNAVLDTGDVLLKSVTHSGALAVGESYTAQATVTLPTGFSMSEGQYYLFVETDSGKSVGETEETNNASSASIDLAFPAHVVFWDGGGDGTSWSDPNNWTRDTLPGVEDRVTVDAPSTLTVVHGSGDDVVRNLVLSDGLMLSGGSLSTADGLTLNATLTLAGNPDDTVLRGTVSGIGSIVVSENSGATLDGVTLNGVSMTVRGQIRVINGLTLQGSKITLLGDTLGSDRSLTFVDTQTLGGTGEVILSGSSSRNLLLGNTGTLTIGSGITVHGGAGIVGNDPGISGASSELFIEGRIFADVSGQEIVVSGNSLINHGTLGASKGGTLHLEGLAPNTGVLDAGAGGLIRIDGDFINEALGKVNVAINGTSTSQYGRVEVDGAAHLGGALNIGLEAGIAPELVLNLPFLTYGSAQGSFASISGLDVLRGSNGTMQLGAGLVSGKVGQAFSLDGVNDYVYVPNSAVFDFGAVQDFAIEGWINLQNPTAGHDDWIVSKIDIQRARTGATKGGYTLELQRDTHRVGLLLATNGSFDKTLFSNTTIPIGEWVHVAAIRRGDSAEIYINGVLDASAILTSASLANNDPLVIGGVYDTASNPPVQQGHSFGGLLDEISIYRRALSSQDVEAIYAAGSAGKGTTLDNPPPAGLVGWWSGDGSPNDFVAAFRFDVEQDANGISLISKPRDLPDLQTDSVSVLPASALSGDSFVVSWKGRNAGVETSISTWYDRVYLSTDNALDAQDLELGRVRHDGSLAKGETYDGIAIFTLPIDLAGNLHVFVKADADFAVFEGLKENNNTGTTATPMTVRLRPVPNLQVASIDAPTQAQPDQTVRVGWAVVNSGEGNAIGPWIDELYLSKDGSLNGATLLTTVQHNGGMIPGADYQAYADVTLPRFTDGDYRFVVRTDATNKVHERFDEGDNVTADTDIVTFGHPDLQVIAISAPDEQQTGYPVRVPVSWTVSNAGARMTIPGAWQDRVIVSRNEVVGDSDDVVAGTFLHAGKLLPGESYSQTQTVSLPIGYKGTYSLFVQTDSGEQVFEGLDNNNNRSQGEGVDVLTVYADLWIDALTASPTPAVSGDPAQFSWIVTNNGIAATGVSNWTDRVILSADEVLDSSDTILANVSHTGVLEVGAKYVGRATAILPNGIEGPYRVFVVSDIASAVYEDGRRDNNTVSRTMDVVPKPPPDLQVLPAITLPAEGQPDRSVSIAWTVTNAGSNPAEGSWVDRVYLSIDASLVGATQVAEVSHARDLAAGGNYTVNTNVTLPRVADGAYKIIVVTDAASAVFEGKSTSTAEQNNTTVSADTIDIRHADLRVTQLTVPEGVIEGFPVRLPVSWTVQNTGERGSLAVTWSDQVILSRNGILGDGDDQVVASFSHFGALRPTESYTRGESVTLPVGVNGDYSIFVRTDAQGQVYEGSSGGEANNGSVAKAATLRTPYADLVVDTVTAPAEALGGDSIKVAWTVRNQGVDATHAQAWTERVVLSRDAILDAGDHELGRITHVGDIEKDGSYSEEATFALPLRLLGEFHIFLSTDASSSVFEDAFENNNTAEAIATLTVAAPPSPELRVTRVTSSATGQAGDAVRVNWTVTNAGAIAARGSWVDRVYLSANGLAEGPVLATVQPIKISRT